MITEILNYFSGNPYAMVWLIPISVAVHEIEEWNILKWYKKHFNDLPPSTNRSIRLHIITLLAFFFLLTVPVALFPHPWLVSPVLIYMSTMIAANTVQHIIWTLQYRDYAPGLCTALICLALTVATNVIFIQEGLILTPFYAISVVAVRPVLRTFRSKGTMTKDVRNVHLFFIRLDKRLFGHQSQ